MFIVVALFVAFILLPLALYAYRAETPANIGPGFQPQPPSMVGVALMTIVPILVIAGIAILVARAVTRPSRGDVYAELARAADLRDRGVLSEDEFQREKQKILARR